jgi:hypothetical protein
VSAPGGPTAGVLARANERAHLHLEQLWLDMMEAVLTVHYPAAHQALDVLEQAIAAHAAVEEEDAFGPFETWLRAQAATGGPEDKTDQHLRGDHVILERAVGGARRQLEALEEQGAPLREVASVLEPFVRLQSVLDHHTTREQRLLYPVLDARLPPAQATALASALLEAVGLSAA